MGSEVASQAIINMLIDLGCEVTVLGYVRTNGDYELRPYEVSAGWRQIETKGAGPSALLWLARSLLRRLPYSIAKFCSDALAMSVSQLMRQVNFDVVIVDHVQMSWLTEVVPLSSKMIGIAHNVEHQMYMSFGQGQPDPLRRWIYRREGRLLQEKEMVFANRVDELWVLTKNDADFFSTIKRNRSIREIPLLATRKPSGARTTAKDFDVGLIGSWTWRANEEGLRWFLDCVYPHLPSDINIHVAGGGARWLAGRYDNVVYDGFVENAQSFLQRARVIAIPTLRGGGIQIKTLDAIVSGERIVATPLALRGINDYPATVAIAETPEKFATLLRSAIAPPEIENLHSEVILWSQSREARFRSEVEAGIRDLVR